MKREEMSAIVCLVISILCTKAVGEISDKVWDKANATFSCYTCLGRDYENCLAGHVTCAGACWKLIDERHSLIAKGCTSAMKKAGMSEEIDTGVKLPWTDYSETIKGIAHFCTHDFCNGAVQVPVFFVLILGCIAFLYITSV
ncbi:unnamed protein product [Soboliphyme baturini]|uniref:Protein quiver n=1 Tax=Soboliphyme baturini TaxID=241478 RepID=A0A183IFP1_9BILA|nr:unnamed protein product [Soboliphyme baturini]